MLRNLMSEGTKPRALTVATGLLSYGASYRHHQNSIDSGRLANWTPLIAIPVEKMLFDVQSAVVDASRTGLCLDTYFLPWYWSLWTLETTLDA